MIKNIHLPLLVICSVAHLNAFDVRNNPRHLLVVGAVATTAAAGYDWYSNPQADPNLVKHVAQKLYQLATTNPVQFAKANKLMATSAYGTLLLLAAQRATRGLAIGKQRPVRARQADAQPFAYGHASAGAVGNGAAHGTGEQPVPGAGAAVVPHLAAGVGHLAGVAAGAGAALTAAAGTGTPRELLAPAELPEATPPPTPAELLAQFNAQLRAPAGADFTALATALARIERHIGNHEPTAVQKALEAAVAQAHPMAIKALSLAATIEGKDAATQAKLRASGNNLDSLKKAAVSAAFKSPAPEASLRALITAGCNLNSSDSYQESAAVQLMQNPDWFSTSGAEGTAAAYTQQRAAAAAYTQKRAALEALLTLHYHGAHINLTQVSNNGRRPLHEAVAQLGSEDCEDRFGAAAGDIRTKPVSDKAQFFTYAIRFLVNVTGATGTDQKDSYEPYSTSISGYSVLASRYGQTPMHVAVERGGANTVKFLVDLGFPYNRRSVVKPYVGGMPCALTPLQFCCAVAEETDRISLTRAAAALSSSEQAY